MSVLVAVAMCVGLCGAGRKVAPNHVVPRRKPFVGLRSSASTPVPVPATPLPVRIVSAPPPPTPGPQRKLWDVAKVRAVDRMRADKEVFFFTLHRDVYERLQRKRENGVPAPFIFCFHMRESDHSFARHLHEGSLLLHRTVDEPKGRIPDVEPPYTFEQSGEDALYGYEHLERRDWQHLETALQAAESYNGLGYQKHGRISPYMWAGTTVYTGGKYVRDGVFSAAAYDQQLGVCAILKTMQDHGIELAFAKQ